MVGNSRIFFFFFLIKNVTRKSTKIKLIYRDFCCQFSICIGRLLGIWKNFSNKVTPGEKLSFFKIQCDQFKVFLLTEKKKQKTIGSREWTVENFKNITIKVPSIDISIENYNKVRLHLWVGMG